MKRQKYDIFLSYRRSDGGAIATALAATLEKRGYRVFIDVQSPRSGPFDSTLIAMIKRTPDFVPLLTMNAITSRDKPDWVLIEAQHALDTERNIVPVRIRGVLDSGTHDLPSPLDKIVKYNGALYDHELLDGTISQLSRLLKSKARRSGRAFNLGFNSGTFRFALRVVWIIPVVIAAAISVPIYSKYAKNSRVTEASGKLGDILTAAKAYAVEHQRPDGAVEWPSDCAAAGFVGDCTESANFYYALSKNDSLLTITATGRAGSPMEGVTATLRITDPSQNGSIAILGL